MNLNTDFAFEGFRILRQRPILFLIWGTFMLLVSAISMYVMTSLAGDTLTQIESMNTNGASASFDEVMSLYAKMGPAYAILLPLSLISSAISVTAVMRAVLRPSESAFGYLRLGGDELRMGILMIVMFFIWIAIVIAVYLVAILAGLAFAALGASLNMPALSGILIFIVFFAALLAMAIFGVRLSLNSAQTFDTKKLDLFGTVKLSKGKAGTLTVGYLIASVMVILTYILLIIIYFAIAATITKGDMASIGQVFGAQMYTVENMSNPVVLLYLALMGGIASPITMAVMYAAPAAAYKVLVGASPSKIADTF